MYIYIYILQALHKEIIIVAEAQDFDRGPQRGSWKKHMMEQAFWWKGCSTHS